MMGVATYVHLVVNDPTLFPLQPEAPVIPLAVIAVSLIPLWIGSGSWSLDLRGQLADLGQHEAAPARHTRVGLTV